MARAIEVAERGRGRVRPNPLVGCVLVKGGSIIAEGWHDHLGGLHAEQMAIHDAEQNGHSPNGSTAYVTLEPCNHHGRTPPCTESLMWAGVKEVVVAHRDPNPTVRGEGIQVLQQAGINVREGLLDQQASQQMQSFLHWCDNLRPLVTLKIAVDCNGDVDERFGPSERFTSDAALDAVHHLRSEVDAVMVGIGTVLKDNPSLTIRRVEVGHAGQPLRVVLDRRLRIPRDCNLLNDGGETLMIHCEGVEPDLPVSCACLASFSDGMASPSAILRMLGDLGHQEVLLEGGPTTAKHFLHAGVVDRAIIIRTDSSFEDGLPLGISDHDFITADLEPSGVTDWGGDSVHLWSRNGLSWPTPTWPLPAG